MKNVVLCCDGTANEFAEHRTNVVKLFYALEYGTERQIAYYRPGIGTMELPGALTGFGKWVRPRAGARYRLTAKIVADLERGIHPWLKPWNAEHAAGRVIRPLRANGQPYKGINVLMLWGDAEPKGFACPIWMTFRQAQKLGGHVKKGEHGSLVVYADKLTCAETGDDGKETLRQIPFMKGYIVFNCEQIEGLPAHFYASAIPPQSDIERIASVENFAADTAAAIRHGAKPSLLLGNP